MICVSIGASRHRHMIAVRKHVASHGIPLVEFRLDYLPNKVSLRRLMGESPCQTIYTCRRAQDGGKFKGSEEDRLFLLRTIIAAGADYIDLEEDVAPKIPRFGKTKRIISLHDFTKTPQDLEAVHARLARMDPDVIKIATLANTPYDNVRMLELIKKSKIPTVGICMGEMGIPSRILAGRYGAPFTFASHSAERAVAPGQINFEQMIELYHYDDITPTTEVYGVIGDPIVQSMSPLLHNSAFQQLGLNKVYLPFRVPKEDLPEFMKMVVPALEIQGLSVTIPHKEAILPFLTKVDGATRAVSATNTAIFLGNEAQGHNTDYRAALESLEEAMGGGTDERSPLAGKTVLILGSGGAARAIAVGVQRRGAQVVVSSRTLARAERLSEVVECRTLDWEARGQVPCDVVVNCTPIGMHPKVNDSSYPKAGFLPGMVAFDTVYNPENTLFIKEAREQGCKVVTGVEMFVRQAALQLDLFTGEKVPVDTLRDILKKGISAVNYKLLSDDQVEKEEQAQ